MSEGGFRQNIPVERIDADAVCERCGSVNPEDTLLCKTCGNNLRDQRARRMAPDAALDIGEVKPSRGVYVRGLLAVLGILVLIWFAVNASRIEDFMVQAQTAKTGDATSYWNGPQSKEFDKLAKELAASPITPEEREQAMKQPAAVSDSYDGRYVLTQKGQLREIPVGQAIVRQEGETIRFVAVLERTGGELRGEAKPEGAARIAARDTAGYLLNGQYYGASGFAAPVATGGLECLGLCDIAEDAFSGNAYRVP